MRSRSRVDPPNGREQEVQMSGRERTWQSAVWPPVAPATKAQEWAGPGNGPSKTMEVVLGGFTKEVDGKKHKVVMCMNVQTGCQTIKMRFKPGEKAEKERLAAINAQRQKADVWQREDLAEPGQEEQSDPAPALKGKDRKK